MMEEQHELNGLFRMTALKAYKSVVLGQYGVAYVHDLSEGELGAALDVMRERRRLAVMPVSEEVRKQRSWVLKQLTAMGVHDGDWARTNGYLLNKRICGKLLFECSLDELKALLKKLRAIGKKYKSRKDLEDYLAANN